MNKNDQEVDSHKSDRDILRLKVNDDKATIEVSSRRDEYKNTDKAAEDNPEKRPTSSKGKKSAKSKKDKHVSIEELLSKIFSVSKDKSGKVKSAKASAADLKALISLEDYQEIKEGSVQALCSEIAQTDPDLSCVASIYSHLIQSTKVNHRLELMDLMIRIISGSWINKHRGSLNSFRDIYQELVGDAKDIHGFARQITALYDKRAASLSRIVKNDNSPQKEVQPNEGEANNSPSTSALTKSQLEKQKNNMLLTGILWLIENGLADIPVTIDYLTSFPIAKGATPGLRDIAIYLVNHCLSPDHKMAKLISIQTEKTREVEEINGRLQTLLTQKESQLSKIIADIAHHKSEIQDLTQQRDDGLTKIKVIEQQMADMKLDEKASRSHLRDSEGKVRAKAHNLLSEEVLEPLRLSLKALQRENPKTEQAAHQIELAIESIERDLPWFKE